MSGPALSAVALRALVVDDEALARFRLKTLLGDCTSPVVTLVGEAGNAVEAMDILRRQTVDVIFLDIRMPGADGLKLAQTLREVHSSSSPSASPATRPMPCVVFVTAHAEHAVQAFELEALDYLTKPVRLERLQQTLQKIERTMLIQQGLEFDLPVESLIIQDRGGTLRLPLAEVLYFKAELKYITVRTLARSYILDGSLGELEDKYSASFLRIHRNALIARKAIRALEKQHDAEEGEGWAVRLDGVPELLFVSRRQVVAVREAISN